MFPRQIKKYFWDVDHRALNIKKYKKYIIERILELGDERAVSWMKKNFSEKDILRALKESRQISFLSSNYWNLVFKKK